MGMQRLCGIVCLLLVSAAGCGPGTRGSGHLLSYEMRTVDSTLGDCGPGGSGCLHVSVAFPQFKGTGPKLLLDSVRSYVDGFVLGSVAEGRAVQSFEALAGELGKGYTELKKEFPEYRQDWYFHRRVEVTADTCGLISLKATEDSYLGGAHPNQAVRLVTILGSSGGAVKLADCLIQGSESRLKDIVEREFRKARNLSADENLEAAGFWFKDGKFDLPANFAVEPAGLFFYYNDYEVAPHALGPTEVRVTFAVLKGIIASDGPLGWVVDPR